MRLHLSLARASQSGHISCSPVQQAGEVGVQALVAADQLVGEGEACEGGGEGRDGVRDQRRRASRLAWNACLAQRTRKSVLHQGRAGRREGRRGM